ncbi:endonuclease [Marivita sp. S0852]|uniref:endonuclease n=1 Tax=Marivita sp. S0852 TaxID=3373893 RepID=UPI0039822FAF
MSCQLGSWALAAGVGLLVFVMLLVVGDWGWLGSIFMAAVAFAVLGVVFGWLFCRELPAPRGPGNIDTGNKSPINAAPPSAKAPSASAPSAAPPSAAPAPVASEATSPATASSSGVKPSAALPGQDDLAARKGEWTYTAGDDQASDDQASKDTKDAGQKAPAADTSSDYDGDGVKEGTEEGTKPATLTEAREGGADNLKEIKGVGPKLEQLLNSMGFYHFDQIANWTADEIAWVNANLEGFKGRVSRDDWVEQAKILASGGDTEFSKRVDKGDVY